MNLIRKRPAGFSCSNFVREQSPQQQGFHGIFGVSSHSLENCFQLIWVPKKTKNSFGNFSEANSVCEKLKLLTSCYFLGCASCVGLLS